MLNHRLSWVAGWWRRLRPWGLSLALLVGLLLLLRRVDESYPIRHWLFWRYLGYWGAGLVFWFAAWSSGDRIVRSIRGRRLPAREQLAVSFALGVLAFATGVFAIGLLHGFGRVFFFAYPLALLASGGPSFYRFIWRFGRRYWSSSGGRRPWAEVTLALGVVGALLVYLPVMTPSNIAYDARWYHLPLAEHYAAAGRVEKFPEGWTLGAYPQLATLHYTWAMQLPFGRLFDRVLLCAHLEWSVFVATLAAIPVLVRRLDRKRSGYRSWLFMFLFPGLFLYDSNLNCGTDHFVAVFAPAAWLTLLRAWRSCDPRAGVLFGLATAGAAVTKYTAIALVGPVCLAMAARFVWLLLSRVWNKGGLTPMKVAACMAATGGTLLGATAMHWLKNVVYYGDPLFPALNAKLSPTPWVPEATIHYQKFMMVWGTWHPTYDMAGLMESLKVPMTFAFEPHDWPSLHGTTPVFGMLFTLSLLALPFCGLAPRLWGIAAACELGVFLWFWTNHQDRYLQAILPWMVALTAVVMGRAFRSGLAPRIACVALCAAQAVWGGDVPFLPTHAMVGDTPLRETARLLGKGYLKHYEERLTVSDMEPVSAALPPGSKVLLHHWHQHLGLNAPTVNDWTPFQSGLAYIRLQSPRGMYEKLRQFGVTHLLFTTSQVPGFEQDSLGSALVFWEFTQLYTRNKRRIGLYTLATMPDAAPAPADAERLALYLGCGKPSGYGSGLYQVSDLGQIYDLPFPAPREPEPPEDAEATAGMLARSAFVAIESCRTIASSQLRGFEKIRERGDTALYARKPSR